MPEGGLAHAVAHKASLDETTILEVVQRCAGLEKEAIVVSVSGWGSHDCFGDAAIWRSG